MIKCHGKIYIAIKCNSGTNVKHLMAESFHNSLVGPTYFKFAVS
jgi:hypothetical protein